MIRLPSAEDTISLADWAELGLLVGRDNILPRHEILHHFEENGVADPEVTVENVWREIIRREGVLGLSYPMELDGSSIRRARGLEECPVYCFLLLTTSHVYYSEIKIGESEWGMLSKVFEKVVTSALATYLGGDSINTGFPREGEVPTGFSDAVRHLAKRIDEPFGRLKNASSDAKDEEVDVVGWIPAIDGRTGKVAVLAQCSIGDNWRGKTGAISISLWRNYVRWGVDPLRAFAVPFTIDDSEWERFTSKGGILFDRLRSAYYASKSEQRETLVKLLPEWERRFISSLRKLELSVNR
jgi:hypothetical protein